MPNYYSFRCSTLLLVATALVGGTEAFAGGGPENVMLVVNDLDDDSKTIANHYIQLRDIPEQNVLYLKWRGSQHNCTGDRFRNELLTPIINAINKRGLALQVDYIVYSAGFPWRVDLTKDFPDRKFDRSARPIASLTGATYLWQLVMAKTPAVVSLATNWYVPKAPADNYLRCASLNGVASRGFRWRYGWLEGGVVTSPSEKSQRYMLSTMLGVTDGRGNTVDEVLRYLRRSVKADRTQPSGTFYFVKTDDIRSKPRDACYAGVAQALQAAGATARVTVGDVPRGARDIMGLMIGAPFCNLPDSEAAILPGAICEHLTSFGGVLRNNSSQMPLTDFLRQGAAGASGTVTEPLAIQAKFPLPSLHLHYRRGCSLAESFYQSVAGPYQLLIVGDPLCQPWAKPPGLQITGLAAQRPRAAETTRGQAVSGTLQFTPHINPGQISTTRPCEVFVDGRLYAPAFNAKPFKLDTTKLTEGHHELRVVAISPDKIESQFHAICPVTVKNQPDFSFTLAPTKTRYGQDESVELVATVKGDLQPAAPTEEPEAKGQPASKSDNLADGGQRSVAAEEAAAEASPRVVFRLHSKVLKVLPLEEGEPSTARLRAPAKRLGLGPLRLTAELLTGGATTGPRTAPVWVAIE